MSAPGEGTERTVVVLTSPDAAGTGGPVVLACADGGKAGAAAATLRAAGRGAACFAVGEGPPDEERAAVEALARECLGATRVVWA